MNGKKKKKFLLFSNRTVSDEQLFMLNCLSLSLARAVVIDFLNIGTSCNSSPLTSCVFSISITAMITSCYSQRRTMSSCLTHALICFQEQDDSICWQWSHHGILIYVSMENSNLHRRWSASICQRPIHLQMKLRQTVSIRYKTSFSHRCYS